ncbi:MAG TPA: response regulator transcription factor [Anaerolineales bacterium]|nr:response regulator transcription factor [Anaerolineales bacterium]
MSKIMVVDDDEDFTSLYKQTLEMAGFEAIVENQSSKAMEVAYTEKPDLFLLDLMMPAPDGFQLCRMIRADAKLKRTPIIIVTALTDLDSKLVAMGAGANDYLTKPFHINDLKSRINVILERRQ